MTAKVAYRLLMPGLLAVLAGLLWANGALAGDSHQYKSRYITIHYQDPRHLAEFARKVAPSAVARKLTQILATSPTARETDLAQFLDGLLKRVQLLLDMPLTRMRINIKILGSDQEVLAAFNRVTGGIRSRYHSQRPPAFYAKKGNTIYLQTQRLSTGMLAHEMAHAVLLHYFRVPPPLKIQEMLAIYVDRQISRQAR